MKRGRLDAAVFSCGVANRVRIDSFRLRASCPIDLFVSSPLDCRAGEGLTRADERFFTPAMLAAHKDACQKLAVALCDAVVAARKLPGAESLIEKLHDVMADAGGLCESLDDRDQQEG